MSDDFDAWAEELADEAEAEMRAEVLSEMDLEEQMEAQGAPTTDVSGSSTSIGDEDEALDALDEHQLEGVEQGPEYETRMEARTVVVHDAPPHEKLDGTDKTEADHWIAFLADPSTVGTSEQDDMLVQAGASTALRDAVIGALWPSGYNDPNDEIPIALTDAELVARVAQTEELISHQIPNTPSWAMAVLVHITAKLHCAAVITGAMGAPWIVQFLSLEEDDLTLLESAKGITPETDRMIQIYLDCVKVARVAG